MNKTLLVFLIAAAVIFLGVLSFGGWVMSSYNQLVSQNQVIDNSWSTVETQYQRRFDLIPNLVAATQGAMNQEKEVFGAIADARTRYAGVPNNSNEKVQATNQYDSAISRLLLVMENYPTLKSIDSVRALTDELAGTENRIAVARDRYNSQVTIWNTMIKVFPKNIIAGMFAFHDRAFFASDTGASSAPKVELNSK